MSTSISAQPMHRTLSTSESGFFKQGSFVLFIVVADGEIDVAAMRRAFAALREAHPLLASVAKKEDGGYVLTDAAEANEIFVVSEGDCDPTTIPGLALDQCKALSGLEVVRSGRRTRVDLHVHHGIADARHGFALLSELWSRYTDVVTTGDTKVEIQPIPKSFEDLLAARGIRKGDRSGLEWLAPPPGAKQPATPRAEPVRHEIVTSRARLRLSAETTSALVRLGHSEDTTVNGLVSTAIMAAVADFHATAATRTDAAPTPLPYIYAVDARTRLTPPVGATEGTTLTTLASYLGLFGPNTSLLDVARGISRRLRAEVDEGIIQQSVLHNSVTTPPEKPVPPTEIVAAYATNWGIVPELRTPDGIVLTDFVGAVRPPATAHVGVPIFVLITFQGRLTLQALFQAARPGLPNAQQLLDAVKTKIDALLA